MSGLKTGMENGMFWSEIGSGFPELGGTPPPRIPRSTSPSPRVKNKHYHVKELLKRFHLNGHTIGFCPQTQKLELHYMSPCMHTVVSHMVENDEDESIYLNTIKLQQS